jgi:hypothetical protein
MGAEMMVVEHGTGGGLNHGIVTAHVIQPRSQPCDCHLCLGRELFDDYIEVIWNGIVCVKELY